MTNKRVPVDKKKKLLVIIIIAYWWRWRCYYTDNCCRRAWSGPVALVDNLFFLDRRVAFQFFFNLFFLNLRWKKENCGGNPMPKNLTPHHSGSPRLSNFLSSTFRSLMHVIFFFLLWDGINKCWSSHSGSS